MQLGPNDPSTLLTDQDLIEQDPAVAQHDDSATTTEQPVAAERLLERIQESDSLPAILFTAGILLMVVILMRRLLRSTKSNRRRDRAMGTPHERIHEIHDHANSSMDQSTRLMVETEEMVRRLGAVLDNKAARLELLIEEADRKLAQLNHETHTTIAPQVIVPPQVMPQVTASQPSTRHIDPSLLDIARVEQDRHDRQSRESSPGSQPTSTSFNPNPIQSSDTHPNRSSPAQPHSSYEEPKPIQTQVQELAEAGYTNHEIAHKLSQPIGQIELILNLHKNKDA